MAAKIRLVPLAAEALRAYPLVKPQTTIGSAPDNDVVIDHQSVSRRHAVIVRRLGGLAVRDLGSTNGTRVNGRKAAARRVRPGDELEFGSVRFAVMNSPRRSWLGPAGSVAVLILLTAAGFALSRYLASRQAGLPSPASSSPNAKSEPASPPGMAAGPSSKKQQTPATAENGAPVQARSESEPLWLKKLNDYRVMAGLAPVREDPELSTGDFAHARYLVKNSGPLIKAGTLGEELHNEDPHKPWYSAAGRRAARSGDVGQWWGSIPGASPPAGWAIDGWIASTWHRMAILNPHLRQVGYGEFCEDGACAAVLDVLSRLDRNPLASGHAPAPIQFPPRDAVMQVNAMDGEWPDPLASCEGYTIPAGLPITLQLGAMVPARLSAYSLRRSSASPILEACGFDAGSYTNANGPDQGRGRDLLKDLGAVVVIPREPLKAGDYTVEMTVNGVSYSWRFTVKREGGRLRRARPPLPSRADSSD